MMMSCHTAAMGNALIADSIILCMCLLSNIMRVCADLLASDKPSTRPFTPLPHNSASFRLAVLIERVDCVINEIQLVMVREHLHISSVASSLSSS